jgi:hypothetical protein
MTRILGKRFFAVLVVVTLTTTAAFAQTSLSTYIGTNLFRYQRAYLQTGLTYHSPVAEQMELHIGTDFGIATEDTPGGVEPSFLIPVNVGLNFTFPFEPLLFYVGTGLTPSFQFGAGQGLSFYMGPYARVGLRYQVHQLMSAFLDVEQDLLIGGPTWINTSTRILVGIYFTLPGGDE